MPNGLFTRLRAALARERPQAGIRVDPLDAPPPPVGLAEVRRRLELLLAGVYGVPVPVAPAEPPREKPIRRLLRRTPGHLRAAAALPSSDGERVLLPARLDEAGPDALRRYRILAIEQAERLARGTARALPANEPPLVRDLFLVAEGAAVDHAIATHAPGLRESHAAERAAALARRPALESLTPAEREVEGLLRRVLAAEPHAALPELPPAGTPAESLAWARATAARMAAAGSRYRGIAPVDAWGTVVPVRVDGAARPETMDPFKYRPRPMGTSGKRGGPQGRGDSGEEGGAPSQTSDPFDGSRKGEAGDPEGTGTSEHGDAPAEFDPDAQARPSSGSSNPQRARDGSAAPQAPPAGIAYPEWDAEAGAYRRPGAWVRIAPPAPGEGEWARQILRAHAATVRRLREQFERLRARRQRLFAQRDGEELDLGACVRALVDVRTGHTVSDRLYAAVRPARRELSILLLVDISGSTTEHVNRVRIIDVEIEALLLASEAFDALGDRYAVLTFSGKGAANVRMRVVKDFGERNGDEVRGRVAALRPEGYTRMGAAIRHASALLAREGARHRLLLIISDGKPNDEDHYQGPYAVEDTRQAVAEARAAGIFPFCVTVDQKGGAYLQRIFGAAGHMILHHPEHLPLALLKVVRGLIRG
ncbi:MAG TPA: VWA domain-containing protein [Longimicrobium sp.]|nr:VWA domain-containing protein [Longimicrobium sp.]